MEHTPFSFPQWINSLVPDDAFFSRAYQTLSDGERAGIKTAIARLYDCYGPRKDLCGEDVRHWTGGFATRSRYESVSFAVVLFDDSLLSPARILAALVPATAMGIEQVLAVRVGNDKPWPESILTGLELAGQELVVSMDSTQVRHLLADLRESDRTGAVLLLGPEATSAGAGEQYAAKRMAFWRPRFSRMASVWMEEESPIDLDALAFMHPDIAFSVFGMQGQLPAENFAYVQGGFDVFLKTASDVAYLPKERMSSAAGHFKLMFGPGMEGCWIWPDLHSSFFQSYGTAWTLGD
ncbi:hypothetical protein [Pseudodesulfovibrio sp.]|uniref:hypothetical protein n=1 Tax=unclassified Pseudodesulfovibrio TaxID=2661612 RepID=UPI003AFFBD3C